MTFNKILRLTTYGPAIRSPSNCANASSHDAPANDEYNVYNLYNSYNLHFENKLNMALKAILQFTNYCGLSKYHMWAGQLSFIFYIFVFI